MSNDEQEPTPTIWGCTSPSGVYCGIWTGKSNATGYCKCGARAERIDAQGVRERRAAIRASSEKGGAR
jgi:hypothetical protein